MKRKRIFARCAALGLCAFAISCATPPASTARGDAAAPGPAAASPATKAGPAIAAPDELRAKAGALRQKAFDLGLKDLVPEDYAVAEKAYASGKSQYGIDNGASAASFAEAAAKYRGVLDEGLPLLAASERKRAELMREKAIAKGAGELFPPQYSYAEAETAKPRASESAADYEAAVLGYRASIRMYEVLYKLCDANARREYIASRDLAKWDTSDWNLAEASLVASRETFATDASAAGASADEAILRYGLARDTALSYYAADRKRLSEAERDRASSIKSEVAAKDEYAAALGLYAEAETANKAQNHETSASLYEGAASTFASAYAHAKAKMDAAKAELESLDAAIANKGAGALR